MASVTDSSAVPDYAPVPPSALGPAVNEQGYYVGQVERNLCWVTDSVYQCAFLTTPDDPTHGSERVRTTSGSPRSHPRSARGGSARIAARP